MIIECYNIKRHRNIMREYNLTSDIHISAFFQKVYFTYYCILLKCVYAFHFMRVMLKLSHSVYCYHVDLFMFVLNSFLRFVWAILVIIYRHCWYFLLAYFIVWLHVLYILEVIEVSIAGQKHALQSCWFIGAPFSYTAVYI